LWVQAQAGRFFTIWDLVSHYASRISPIIGIRLTTDADDVLADVRQGDVRPDSMGEADTMGLIFKAFAALNTGGDDTVLTQDELDTQLTQDVLVKHLPAAVFHQLDADGDGQVTAAEIMAALDLDHSGGISVTEFIRGIKKLGGGGAPKPVHTHGDDRLGAMLDTVPGGPFTHDPGLVREYPGFLDGGAPGQGGGDGGDDDDSDGSGLSDWENDGDVPSLMNADRPGAAAEPFRCGTHPGSFL